MLRGQSFEPEEGDAGVDEARAGRMADAMEKDRENLPGVKACMDSRTGTGRPERIA